MSDLLVNVRLGLYHIQVTRGLRFRVSRNPFHRGFPQGRFAVYAWPTWADLRSALR